MAALEPSNPVVLDSVKGNATRRTGDFQVTPSGGYAAFTSNLVLTGVHTFGYRAVFRYAAPAGQLICVSCDHTTTNDGSLPATPSWRPTASACSSDGRVFFVSRLPLVISDAEWHASDVYEWEDGRATLISAGSGPFDSTLLTASANGVDVFFFTHEALAPGRRPEWAATKIYDAREGGGFFYLPQEVPCKASDECHGPSTPAPGPADIKSSGRTTNGNVVVCPKNRVKKRGQCVKKPAQRKRSTPRRKAAPRSEMPPRPESGVAAMRRALSSRCLACSCWRSPRPLRGRRWRSKSSKRRHELRSRWPS